MCIEWHRSSFEHDVLDNFHVTVKLMIFINLLRVVGLFNINLSFTILHKIFFDQVYLGCIIFTYLMFTASYESFTASYESNVRVSAKENSRRDFSIMGILTRLEPLHTKKISFLLNSGF